MDTLFWNFLTYTGWITLASIFMYFGALIWKIKGWKKQRGLIYGGLLGFLVTTWPAMAIINYTGTYPLPPIETQEWLVAFSGELILVIIATGLGFSLGISLGTLIMKLFKRNVEI